MVTATRFDHENRLLETLVVVSNTIVKATSSDPQAWQHLLREMVEKWGKMDDPWGDGTRYATLEDCAFDLPKILSNSTYFYVEVQRS